MNKYSINMQIMHKIFTKTNLKNKIKPTNLTKLKKIIKRGCIFILTVIQCKHLKMLLEEKQNG